MSSSLLCESSFTPTTTVRAAELSSPPATTIWVINSLFSLALIYKNCLQFQRTHRRNKQGFAAVKRNKQGSASSSSSCNWRLESSFYGFSSGLSESEFGVVVHSFVSLCFGSSYCNQKQQLRRHCFLSHANSGTHRLSLFHGEVLGRGSVGREGVGSRKKINKYTFHIYLFWFY